MAAEQALLLLRDDPHGHVYERIAISQTLATDLIALTAYHQAEGVLEQALEWAERIPDRIELMTALGNLQRLDGRYGDAKALLAGAISLGEDSGADAAHIAIAHNAAGILCKDLGRYVDARKHYEVVIAMDPAPALRAAVLHNMAGLLHAQERFEEAETPARAALECRMSLVGECHPDVAGDRAVLGAVLLGQRRFVEAEVEFERSLRSFRQTYGADHYEVAANLENLAVVYANTKRLASAESTLLSALALKSAVLHSRHPDIGYLRNNLGLVCEASGRPEEARAHYTEAIDIFSASLGTEHPATLLCRRQMARLA